MRTRHPIWLMIALMILLLVPAGVSRADSGGLTASIVGSISNHFTPKYNPGDGFLWTMTTAGFDQIGKLSLTGTFTMVDSYVGGGGGASPNTMQMLPGVGTKGTLFVYDCNWGGSWWRYDAATGAKTSIGTGWTTPAAPNPGCGAQLMGMATNRNGTVLYHHVGDKIWELDPTAHTARVVLTNAALAGSNALTSLEYDRFTDTLIGHGAVGGQTVIYRLDVAHGTMAPISVPGLTNFYSPVPDPSTGFIYAVPSPNPNGTLYEIDSAAGTYATFQLGAGTFTYISSFGPARAGTGKSLYGLLSGSPNKVVEIAGNFPVQPPPPVDTTPPEINVAVSPSANPAGWWNGPVTVTWATEDPESGVAARSGCETISLATDTAGTVITCTATNGAGLTSTRSATVRIDQTPPVITYSGNAGTYAMDQTVAISCAAHDGLSGLAANTCADVTGPAYSFAPGTNTFSAVAADLADNAAIGSTSFTVVVTYSGLANLVDRFVNHPGLSKSLQAKLRAAEAAAARGNTGAASGILNAFVNEVTAQTGKAITAEHAELLIRLAHSL